MATRAGTQQAAEEGGGRLNAISRRLENAGRTCAAVAAFLRRRFGLALARERGGVKNRKTRPTRRTKCPPRKNDARSSGCGGAGEKGNCEGNDEKNGVAGKMQPAGRGWTLGRRIRSSNAGTFGAESNVISRR